MIEQILPAGAASAEAFGDPPGLVLFPEEEALVARAVDKRRREFTTARACARTALAGLGVEPMPILPGERGAPQWPPGERKRLRDLAVAAQDTCWDRLLFSAKETTYQAWSPLARRWLGFEDADITINATDGTFDHGCWCPLLRSAAPRRPASPAAGSPATDCS